MSPCEKLCAHPSAAYYRGALILVVLFILSIVLCVCVRLLVIVTFIHHIVH